jgi:hypothetical protein
MGKVFFRSRGDYAGGETGNNCINAATPGTTRLYDAVAKLKYLVFTQTGETGRIPPLWQLIPNVRDGIKPQ